MNLSTIILPITGATTGLLAGAILIGPFLKMLASPVSSDDVAGKIVELLKNRNDSVDPIREQLGSSTSIEPLIPFIENHIDDFLRNRLKIAIPMIGMLIGDRTIAQLKEVFMKELESILPQVIDEYVKGMKDKIDMESLVKSKLQAIPQAKIDALLRPGITKMLLLTGFFAGLLAGFVNMLIILALEPPMLPRWD